MSEHSLSAHLRRTRPQIRTHTMKRILHPGRSPLTLKQTRLLHWLKAEGIPLRKVTCHHLKISESTYNKQMKALARKGFIIRQPQWRLAHEDVDSMHHQS